MLKKLQEFNFGFSLIFIVQLVATFDSSTHLLIPHYVQYISKPLITLSLFGLLLFQTGLRGRFSKRIGFGLLFGLAGDVFLLFDKNEVFFICGLVAFLIGHLLYASAFYLDYKLNKTVYQKYTENAVMAYSFFVVIFVVGMWTYLGNMKFPVIVYALVISLMGVMAVNRYGRVNSLSFKLTFYGSILFVISDTVLAINRFVHDFNFSGVIVIVTYMAAQYLITFGNLERKMKKRVEEI